MTPAQVDALARVHRRVNDPKGRGASRAEADEGTVSDLLALSKMKAV